MCCQRQPRPERGFPLYDPAQVTDVEAEFAAEQIWKIGRMEGNDIQKQPIPPAVFKRRGKRGTIHQLCESIAHTQYDDHGHYQLLPGEKAVFLNPLTTHNDIRRL